MTNMAISLGKVKYNITGQMHNSVTVANQKVRYNKDKVSFGPT